MTDYNGWKNYETWNVALWIGNDEGLYNRAKGANSYSEFVVWMNDLGGELDGCCSDVSIYYQTPDGVAWNDSGLDIAALDEMIAEL